MLTTFLRALRSTPRPLQVLELSAVVDVVALGQFPLALDGGPQFLDETNDIASLDVGAHGD